MVDVLFIINIYLCCTSTLVLFFILSPALTSVCRLSALAHFSIIAVKPKFILSCNANLVLDTRQNFFYSIKMCYQLIVWFLLDSVHSTTYIL